MSYGLQDLMSPLLPLLAPHLGIEPSKTSFGGSSVPSTQGRMGIIPLALLPLIPWRQ